MNLKIFITFMQPLVSVICLCHNHERFLQEAIDSVLDQTYPNIEIVVVDDASTDSSKALLKDICVKNNLPFIDIAENIGNCAAFNKGFSVAKGKYVIDFATDDVMMPERIGKQVQFFEKQQENVGVIFSNAQFMDEKGGILGTHYKTDTKGNVVEDVPDGEVYAIVLERYFISPPTMMMRRKVLEDLGGYDESMAYEDFDFWVRSARSYEYAFQPEILTKIRRVKASLSSQYYKPGDGQLMSTYRVCLKAVALNRSEREEEALIKRLRYEARHAMLTGNHKEAALFFDLLEKQQGMNLGAIIVSKLNNIGFSLKRLRRFYLRLRWGKKSS